MVLITNLCGYAHPKNQFCRECERLKKVVEQSAVQGSERAAPAPMRSVSDDPKVADAREVKRDDSRLGGDDSIPTGKALSVAERSKRYRQRKGDEYRKANAARMRKARGK